MPKPKPTCLLGCQGKRLCNNNDALMSLTSYRFEAMRVKGPFRADYVPEPCKIDHHSTVEAVHQQNEAHNDYYLGMWRDSIDDRKRHCFHVRRRAGIDQEVLIERKTNIMIRREALRCLFDTDRDEQEKDLNSLGLSFYKQLFD